MFGNYAMFRRVDVPARERVSRAGEFRFKVVVCSDMWM